MLAFLFALALATVTPDVRFVSARPVWPTAYIAESNVNIRLTAHFVGGPDARLRIAGADAYKVRLNGMFAWYGPARACSGYHRIDDVRLDVVPGTNVLELVAQSYGCATYCVAKNDPFVQAEVLVGGRPVVWTAADGGGFSATRTERVQKVGRYSYQRAFAESYRFGGTAAPLEKLAEQSDKRYLPRIAPAPSFVVNGNLRVLSRANVRFAAESPKSDYQFDCAAGEVEERLWDQCLRIFHTNRVAVTRRAVGEPVRLESGESALMDAGLNDCGFFGMTVEVKRPGRLLWDFDEILTEGEVDPCRMCCCNLMSWRFERPGRYEVETFDPYVGRYGNLSAEEGGSFVISDLHVRGYKNGQIGRAAFRCSDPAYEKIFAAAQETFAQNAVDVFTDCPGRERAGWLCDSFFSGRVNKYLCGDTRLEKLFLQNYLLPEAFDNVPPGMFPMCYPAQHEKDSFIPNWAMWLVLEAEEYLSRSGDRETVDALKPRFFALVDFLHRFRNSDGLLEKLPSWVFVEWSKANELVQDVNYPSNMTWAEALDALDRLYCRPEFAAEAKKIRETIRRQSWTGKWFCDNAVRQPDGTLKLSGECTETCQYYAFFFKTATPESHPELWKTLIGDFGPKRKLTKKHPEIWPSNAFIGNYLRLELLSRAGLTKDILAETKDFFLYMAERTGTLWEMISTEASCDHGFASHAVVYLYRDVLGVKSVNVRTREIVVRPPEDIPLDWCEGTLPVSAEETVSVRWRRGEQPQVVWLKNGERICK